MATQWQRWGSVALFAAACVGIAGCGGGSDDDTSSSAGGMSTEQPAAGGPVGGPGARIEVIGKEFSYNPTTLAVKAGQPTTIVLKNTGSIEHDIKISEAGFKLTVAGNNTGEKVLTADKAGTYEMYCSVAGHKDAGMKGQLVVE